ncbi:MAG: hypothetical protein U1F10_08540 [Burkholderiales bacterium]
MVRKVLKIDIARALDISASMVSRHAKRGMPTHNVELARAWCDNNLVTALRKERRTIGAPRTVEQPPAWTAAGAEYRLRRDAAEAKRAEIIVRKMAGELVNWSKLKAILEDRMGTLTAQLDVLPDRAAVSLGVSDEHRHKVRAYLREEINRIRNAATDLADRVPVAPRRSS